jgi:hypothetical protein
MILTGFVRICQDLHATRVRSFQNFNRREKRGWKMKKAYQGCQDLHATRVRRPRISIDTRKNPDVPDRAYVHRMFLASFFYSGPLSRARSGMSGIVGSMVSGPPRGRRKLKGKLGNDDHRDSPV